MVKEFVFHWITFAEDLGITMMPVALNKDDEEMKKYSVLANYGLVEETTGVITVIIEGKDKPVVKALFKEKDNFVKVIYMIMEHDDPSKCYKIQTEWSAITSLDKMGLIFKELFTFLVKKSILIAEENKRNKETLKKISSVIQNLESFNLEVN